MGTGRRHQGHRRSEENLPVRVFREPVQCGELGVGHVEGADGLAERGTDLESTAMRWN
jgi:hypothetical protein